jgi:septum formation inhibitor MinC
MKRHPYLQPLSRHHHHALVAVLLVKKGIQKKADLTVMQRFIKVLFEEEIQIHFRLEEERLLLVMAEESEVCEYILNEHAELRQLYLEATSEDANTETIQAFAILLEQHIRNEERIYFPLFEQRIRSLPQECLQPDIPEMNGACIDFKPAFWQ